MKKVMIIIGVLLIIVIVIPFIINAYVKGSTKSRIRENSSEIGEVEAIVILGCEVKDDGTLSFMLKDRLDKGIEVYQKQINCKVIVSGDNREKSNNETNVMKQYMIEHGVSEQDIIMDSAGFSTYDSMYRMKYTFDISKCIVITQKYHLYRAIYIGNQLGIDTYGVASAGDNYAGQMWRDIREFLARNKDFAKCIFKPKSTYLEKDLTSENTTNEVMGDKE